MDCVAVITVSQCVSDVVPKIKDFVPDLLIFNLDLHAINSDKSTNVDLGIQ